MLDRRRFLQSALGLVAVSAATPRSIFSQTPLGSISFGFSLPLTGPDAADGQELLGIYQGVLGAIDGLDLNFLDDGGDVAKMRSNYKELAAERVTLLAGVLGETRVREVSRLNESIPALTLGVAPHPLSASSIQSLRPGLESEADAIAEGIGRLGLKKVALLYSLEPSGRRLRDLFARSFAAQGIEVVAEASSRPGGRAEKNPRELSAELRRRGAELIVSAERGEATARVVQVSRDFGWNVPVVCSSYCDLRLLSSKLLGEGSVSVTQLVVARALGTGSGDSPEARGYGLARQTPASLPETVGRVELKESSEIGLEAFLQARFIQDVAAPSLALPVEGRARDLARGVEDGVKNYVVSGRPLADSMRFYEPAGSTWTPSPNWTNSLVG